MTSYKTFTNPALVLKYFPYQEADLIVTMLTKDHGKVQAIAKGARKLQSKFSGHIEPLTVVNVQLAKGKSLDTVTQVQTDKAYPQLYDDLHKLAHGIYISELIDQFTPEREPNRQIFEIGLKTLDVLSKSDSPELGLLNFEFQILKFSGFLPELFNCVICEAEIKPTENRYSPNRGGVVCLSCSNSRETIPLSLSGMKILRHFNLYPVAQHSGLKIRKETYFELKTLLLETIIFWLEKDLNSSGFVEHLRILQNTSANNKSEKDNND